MTNHNKTLCVAKGDGIGPEIMDAVLEIFKAADVPLDYDFVDMGRDIFLKGYSSGMTEEAKSKIETSKLLFKGPMETPKGKGNKSINVTARKMWNTFANYRRFRSIPGVETVFSKAQIPVDLTIIRENLEDTYGGVEHLLNEDVAISRRFITKAGCLQVHKYAFELATAQGIKEVYCGHKANIMKITDGMFLETFYEVAKDYPHIEAHDLIVDDLCMKLVVQPHLYKIIVLPNLQGDIVSDLCAGLVGGLGFAPSANIGSNMAIFEAVHGTAPTIAGQGVANPTALLLSGIMMLQFLGLNDKAKMIEDALLKTLYDKVHTQDIKLSDKPVSTSEYAKAIISRLDKNSQGSALSKAPTVQSQSADQLPLVHQYAKLDKGEVVGCDFFIDTNHKPHDLGVALEALIPQDKFTLVAISNRGTMVYPKSSLLTECVTNFTVRVEAKNKGTDLNTYLELAKLINPKFSITSIELLKHYDGKAGYSLNQGQ